MNKIAISASTGRVLMVSDGEHIFMAYPNLEHLKYPINSLDKDCSKNAYKPTYRAFIANEPLDQFDNIATQRGGITHTLHTFNKEKIHALNLLRLTSIGVLVLPLSQLYSPDAWLASPAAHMLCLAIVVPSAIALFVRRKRKPLAKRCDEIIASANANIKAWRAAKVLIDEKKAQKKP